MDQKGFPTHLFTTNRWVTGEHWYGAADVTGALAVSGAATFSGGVNGPLDVTGNGTVSGTMAVDGATTVGGKLRARLHMGVTINWDESDQTWLSVRVGRHGEAHHVPVQVSCTAGLWSSTKGSGAALRGGGRWYLRSSQMDSMMSQT